MICGGFGVTIHCRLMLRFSLDVVSLFKVDVGCDLWIWFNVNLGYHARWPGVVIQCGLGCGLLLIGGCDLVLILVVIWG